MEASNRADNVSDEPSRTSRRVCIDFFGAEHADFRQEPYRHCRRAQKASSTKVFASKESCYYAMKTRKRKHYKRHISSTSIGLQLLPYVAFDLRWLKLLLRHRVQVFKSTDWIWP
jgi:hypothetical protein